MRWTTKYPKEVGFYWIQNYHIVGRMENISRSEPTIAYVEKVGTALKFWLFQWPDIFPQSEVLKAEWQGPIMPASPLTPRHGAAD